MLFRSPDFLKTNYVHYYPDKFTFRKFCENIDIETIKSLLNYYKFEFNLMDISKKHIKEIEDYTIDKYGGLNAKGVKY